MRAFRNLRNRMYGRFRSPRARRIVLSGLALLVVLLIAWVGYSRLAELSQERENELTATAIVRLIYPDTPPARSILRPDLIPTAESLLRQPEMLPDHLRITPEPGQAGPVKRLCITLIQDYLWEPGDVAETLDSYLVDHAQLTLDGERISAKYRGEFFTILTRATIFLNGQILGSYGGPTEGCFSVNLGPGLHLVTIDVISDLWRGPLVYMGVSGRLLCSRRLCDDGRIYTNSKLSGSNAHRYFGQYSSGRWYIRYGRHRH